MSMNCHAGLKEELFDPRDTQSALTHPIARELLFARNLLLKSLLNKSGGVRR